MLIQRLEVDEKNNIILVTRMDNDQVRVAKERASNLMQYNDTTDIVSYPVLSILNDTPNGFKQVVDCNDPDMALRVNSWRLWWKDHYDNDG